jgi:hypothetical protein
MKNFSIALLGVLILVSCYRTAPEPTFDMSRVLPADTMVSLLVDVHLAEGAMNVGISRKPPIDQLASRYFETVLEKHAIDRKTFEESIRYYSFHAEQFNEIYEKVINELGKKESLYRQQIEKQEAVE